MLKKILISVYAGFVLYSFITFFSGSGGMSNTKVLKYFKSSMVKHVEKLEIKSKLLEDEIDRLNTSQDRLKVAVRPLGYVEPGQSVLKVLNFKSKNQLYEIDRQYSFPRFKKITTQTLLVSALFSVILFVISLFIGVMRDTYKRE